MKTILVLLFILLIAFSSCKKADPAMDMQNNLPVITNPGVSAAITSEVTENPIEQADSLLSIDIEGEYPDLTIENGKYDLTSLYQEMLQSIQAKIIGQDGETFTVQLAADYTDSRFLIPGNETIQLSISKTTLAKVYMEEFDRGTQGDENAYYLEIIPNITTEKGSYDIGRLSMRIVEHRHQLMSTKPVFTPNDTYRLLEFISSKDLFKNSNMDYISANNYEVKILDLNYTGNPGEYFGYKNEEKMDENNNYGYLPVDGGKLYQLSKDCKIYKITLRTMDDEPENYPYQYHIITEKELRSSSTTEFWLYTCWIKDGLITRIEEVASP